MPGDKKRGLQSCYSDNYKEDITISCASSKKDNNMKWKKKASNFIVVVILSLAYTIVTLLNIIGPLHANLSGGINHLGWLAVYSVIYLVAALVVSWGLYFNLKNKPEFLFFTLIILGIVIIIVEVFIWGFIGS